MSIKSVSLSIIKFHDFKIEDYMYTDFLKEKYDLELNKSFFLLNKNDYNELKTYDIYNELNLTYTIVIDTNNMKIHSGYLYILLDSYYLNDEILTKSCINAIKKYTDTNKNITYDKNFFNIVSNTSFETICKNANIDNICCINIIN